MDSVGAKVKEWQGNGEAAVFARVIDLQGFSTWSGDELVAISSGGERCGDILGRYGAEQLTPAAAELLDAGGGRLARLVIDVHGSRIAEAGLSCGGRAELLLQPVDSVPAELWAAIAGRHPVALLTRIEGAGAGPAGVAVWPDGRWAGRLGAPGADRPAGPDESPTPEAIDAAVSALAAGRSSSQRIETPAGVVLVDAWVPHPRLIVVGGGELVGAIDRQGRLLGWETRATEDADDLGSLLGWAGAASALVVLSHDPRQDVPALRQGLEAEVAYVGAMGSHRTQSRRLERLQSEGVAEERIRRIHRPIGLDLGGRSAPEVALSICAQILAVSRGRRGSPLSERQGPINERPGVRAGV
ncbi:MAG TPA: XdhC family protein [Acidimicrobiales bacterium]|nr:XdhC family protein [Acidimicrobiales bacterium]